MPPTLRFAYRIFPDNKPRCIAPQLTFGTTIYQKAHTRKKNSLWHFGVYRYASWDSCCSILAHWETILQLSLIRASRTRRRPATVIWMSCFSGRRQQTLLCARLEAMLGPCPKKCCADISNPREQMESLRSQLSHTC